MADNIQSTPMPWATWITYWTSSEIVYQRFSNVNATVFHQQSSRLVYPHVNRRFFTRIINDLEQPFTTVWSSFRVSTKSADKSTWVRGRFKLSYLIIYNSGESRYWRWYQVSVVSSTSLCQIRGYWSWLGVKIVAILKLNGAQHVKLLEEEKYIFKTQYFEENDNFYIQNIG